MTEAGRQLARDGDEGDNGVSEREGDRKVERGMRGIIRISERGGDS